MISLNIGSPPGGAEMSRDTIVWIVQALYQIQRHLQMSDANVVYDAYTVDGPPTEMRTLNATGSGGVPPTTLDDVTFTLATLIKDFRERGPKGV